MVRQTPWQAGRRADPRLTPAHTACRPDVDRAADLPGRDQTSSRDRRTPVVPKLVAMKVPTASRTRAADRPAVAVDAGLVVVGSLIFVVAAFLPVSTRVLPEPTGPGRARILAEAPAGWVVAQVLFAVGFFSIGTRRAVTWTIWWSGAAPQASARAWNCDSVYVATAGPIWGECLSCGATTDLDDDVDCDGWCGARWEVTHDPDYMPVVDWVAPTDEARHLTSTRLMRCESSFGQCRPSPGRPSVRFGNTALRCRHTPPRSGIGSTGYADLTDPVGNRRRHGGRGYWMARWLDVPATPQDVGLARRGSPQADRHTTIGWPLAWRSGVGLQIAKPGTSSAAGGAAA